MLKFLGKFDNFKEVESDEFIELFKKDYNMLDLKTNDVIVTVGEDDFESKVTNEIYEGMIITNKVSKNNHFSVVYNRNYLIDVMFNEDGFQFIRIRPISILDKFDKKYRLLIN
jgi:hypothetical protein